MNDVLLVLVILLTVVTVLLALAGYKAGSPRKALRRLRESGATGGIVAVVAAVLILGTVLSFVVPSKANASQASEASEIQYFKYTAIFAGLDYEIGSNVFCYKGDINDKLVSNVGVTQHLVGRGNVNVEAKYQHHSCALNRDKPTYDSLGLNLEWRFNWQ